MTSNKKQFTVTREMFTAFARDQRWTDVLAGISARFSKFAFVLFCHITNHLMTGPLGNSEFLFSSNPNVPFVSGNIKILDQETKHTVPLGSSLNSGGTDSQIFIAENFDVDIP